MTTNENRIRELENELEKLKRESELTKRLEHIGKKAEEREHKIDDELNNLKEEYSMLYFVLEGMHDEIEDIITLAIEMELNGFKPVYGVSCGKVRMYNSDFGKYIAITNEFNSINYKLWKDNAIETPYNKKGGCVSDKKVLISLLQNSIDLMNKFVEDFPKFKDAFYKAIDNL